MAPGQVFAHQEALIFFLIFHVNKHCGVHIRNCFVARQDASDKYPQHTPQPLYNTIVGVHSINGVS